MKSFASNDLQKQTNQTDTLPLQFPVVFIRGLNSWGDDRIHIGPLRLQHMWEPFRQAMQDRKVRFIPIQGMGKGRRRQHVDQAFQILKTLGVQSFHILAHSAGGIVARQLIAEHHSQLDVRSLLTIATPHHGAHIANKAISFHQQNPMMYTLCKASGYDTCERANLYAEYTPESMEAFNDAFPRPPHLPAASISCAVPFWDLPLGPKLLSWAVRKTYGSYDSDGIIEESSQRWQNHLDRFELDHAAQLGFSFHLRPQRRRQSQENFHNMVNCAVNYFMDVESGKYAEG